MLKSSLCRVLSSAVALSIMVSAVAGTSRSLADAPQNEIQQFPKGPYDVKITKNVMVRMPDGVHLATDIHMPVGAGDKLPAILIRTPYDKSHMRKIGPMWGYAERMFAEHGFVVVVQDTRGRYASEGDFTISGGDVEDSHATIDWIVQQPWSDGNVGTHGCSYLGEIQARSVAKKNDNLKAMLVQAGGGAVGSADNRYRYFAYWTGGALELASTLNWVTIAGSKHFMRPPVNMSREDFNIYEDMFRKDPMVPEYDIDAVLKSLPVLTMDERAGLPPTDWKDSVSRPITDPWWDQFGYLKGTETVHVPSLVMDSWPDLAVGESIYLHNMFKANAANEEVRDNQYLIIAPTTHCAYEWSSEKTVVGERDLGDTRFDYFGTYLNWFNYWLKGQKDALANTPKVQYYLIGKNEWRSAEAFPVPGTEFRKLYLTSDGPANSLNGKGRLTWTPPQKKRIDNFTYDPANPVPTRGGPTSANGVDQGFYDQTEIEKRDDVLVYTSDPLTKDLEIAGPIEAELYVSSSARDTDITVKLLDVFPDGRAFNIKDGIFRLRYHDGFDKPKILKNGKVYRIKVDLQAIGIYLPASHRIRVEVSSSNFPRFNRNLNTGGDNERDTDFVTAKNTVHHGGSHLSHVVIPIVPAK